MVNNISNIALAAGWGHNTIAERLIEMKAERDRSSHDCGLASMSTPSEAPGLSAPTGRTCREPMSWGRCAHCFW